MKVWVEHPNVPESLHQVEMERFEGSLGMNGWMIVDPPEEAVTAATSPEFDHAEARRVELAEAMKAGVGLSTKQAEERVLARGKQLQEAGVRLADAFVVANPRLVELKEAFDRPIP